MSYPKVVLHTIAYEQIRVPADVTERAHKIGRRGFHKAPC